MPIPNDQFRPPVVCNRFHNEQIAAWINDRPVPTMEELGAKPPLTVSERAARQRVVFANPAVDRAFEVIDSFSTKSSDGEVGLKVRILTPKLTTPQTQVAIKRPPAIIGAPTRILPPPKKRA